MSSAVFFLADVKKTDLYNMKYIFPMIGLPSHTDCADRSPVCERRLLWKNMLLTVSETDRRNKEIDCPDVEQTNSAKLLFVSELIYIRTLEIVVHQFGYTIHLV